MSPSRAATAALVLTTIGTAAGIAYIHYDQSAERQVRASFDRSVVRVLSVAPRHWSPYDPVRVVNADP